MKILVTDKSSYSISKREYLENGFLKVPGRVARTGIQQYLASELNVADRNPGDIINVFRPPQEVFSQESLASYKGTDVTDDHPTEMVDAANYKRYSVGHVEGEGYQDGDFVVADMIIKDAEAIKKIESGKAQLSAGYYAEYKKESGVTPEGQAYDFIQTEIKINHVALVDRARAGAQARIFDQQKGGDMPTLTIDGATIELQDAASVALVRKALDEANKKAEDMKEERDKAKEAKDKAEAKKDKAEEERDEEKAEKEKAQDALSVFLAKEVVDSAKRIASVDFSCDSKDLIEIKRAALNIVRPKVDWADKSATYVEVAYDAEKEKMEDMEEEEAKDEKGAKDSYASLAKDMSPSKDAEPKMSAYDAYCATLTNPNKVK